MTNELLNMEQLDTVAGGGSRESLFDYFLLMEYGLMDGTVVFTGKEKNNALEEVLEPTRFAYDDAFRTMAVDCDDVVLAFINYLFGESYGKDTAIIRRANESYVSGQYDSDKRITDGLIEVFQNKIKKTYHLECESSRTDESILVRIFEYDSQTARTDFDGDRFKVRFRFPNSGLLILRRSKTVPVTAIIELEMPDGKETSYEVPVLKMWDYSIDDIFKNNLFMLIPFYIFNLERDFDRMDKDDVELESLSERYNDIIARLKDENEKGNLSSVSLSVIIKLINIVAHNFTKSRRKINEKVGDIMGGQVLDLPEFKIFDDGKAEGRAEGRAEGKAEERLEGIRIFIEDKIEDGIPQEKIIEKLQKKFGLTKKVAKVHIQQCMSAIALNLNPG